MPYTEFKCRTENGVQPDITAFFAQTVRIDRFKNSPNQVLLLRFYVALSSLRNLLCLISNCGGKVLSVGSEHSQVCWVVVDGYPINMVNNLTRKK